MNQEDTFIQILSINSKLYLGIQPKYIKL